MNLVIPAGKFIALIITSIYVYHANMTSNSLVLLVILALFYLYGYNYKTIWQQLRVIGIFLIFLLGMDCLTMPIGAAVLCVTRVVILYLLAALISLTTPISLTMVMFEKLLSPLRLFKINVKAVALIFAMSLRFIPLVSSLIQQIREAQKARNIERDMLSLLQASFVNILKMQNAVAEAIEARGFSLEE